jgi:NitT/TauT family transport system substrate-binding protein
LALHNKKIMSFIYQQFPTYDQYAEQVVLGGELAVLRPLVKIFGVGVVVATALLATACADGSGPGAAGGLEKTNLTVAAVPSFDSASVYVAEQRGLFAAAGLHVKIVPAVSSSTVIAGQLAGKYDVTVGAYPGYILADALHHADLRILAPASDLAPLTKEVLVPPGSPIENVSQLKGKRIAVNALNNVGTLLVSSLLSNYAIPATDVDFVPMPFQKMAAALAAGTVDAAWLSEPFVTGAEESVGAVPVADTDQGSAQGIPVSGYAVTQSWLDKYPRTAAAFRRAVLKAQAIANTNLAAVQNAMVAYGDVSRSTAEIASEPVYPLQTDPGLLQRVANLMEQFGMTTQVFDVSRIIRG